MQVFYQLGDPSFYTAAPKLWNDLPLFIRNKYSVNGFKKALKGNLFQKAFLSWFIVLFLLIKKNDL